MQNAAVYLPTPSFLVGAIGHRLIFHAAVNTGWRHCKSVTARIDERCGRRSSTTKVGGARPKGLWHKASLYHSPAWDTAHLLKHLVTHHSYQLRLRYTAFVSCITVQALVSRGGLVASRWFSVFSPQNWLIREWLNWAAYLRQVSFICLMIWYCLFGMFDVVHDRYAGWKMKPICLLSPFHHAIQVFESVFGCVAEVPEKW